MKVLLASIFALIAVANAASFAGGSQENHIAAPSQAGLFMVGYIMKKIAQPTVTMVNLIKETFPDIETGSEFKDSVEKLDECLTDANSRNVTVCAKLNVITDECLVAVSESYEKNLPETSRDISKMITDSYASVVKHVCNSKTEEFLELSNECLVKPGTQEQRDAIIKMYEKKAKIFKAAPTKANLCGIVEAVRPLIEAPIKQSCQSDVTVKAFTALYDASATPCNNV